LRDLFSNNDKTISQTDIVMLLTPHIVRSMEITEADLRPLFIGSTGTLGIGGPPPLIASPEPAPAAPTAAPPPNPGAVAVPGGVVVPPPGSSPVPGTIFVPSQPPLPPPPPTNNSQGAAVSPPPAPTPALPDATTVQTSTQGVGAAQITVTPPAGTIRVGGGPYTVPIYVANAARLSTITLTLTFDPAILRVRAVNEGGFMRSGGASATFTQQVGTGRVDVTIARSADSVGASGQGVLGGIVFDAVAPGNVTLSLSGAATGPGGTAMGLQFRPVTVLVQP
jgi:hypothetical protein